MKLSQLEALVRRLREATAEHHQTKHLDPDVTFYKSRTSEDPEPGKLESRHFVEFDLTDGCLGDANEMRVVGDSLGDVRAQPGDFNLPVATVNFYKE